MVRNDLGSRESGFTSKSAEWEPDCAVKTCRGALVISPHFMVHVSFQRLQYAGLLLEVLYWRGIREPRLKEGRVMRRGRLVHLLNGWGDIPDMRITT
jgi:hypothetical protein